MQAPVSVGTLSQEALSSNAFHVIQQKRPTAFPKSGLDGGSEGSSTAQLPTQHVGVVHVPEVIANSAPLALVENLHTSGTSA